MEIELPTFFSHVTRPLNVVFRYPSQWIAWPSESIARCTSKRHGSSREYRVAVGIRPEPYGVKLRIPKVSLPTNSGTAVSRASKP